MRVGHVKHIAPIAPHTPSFAGAGATRCHGVVVAQGLGDHDEAPSTRKGDNIDVSETMGILQTGNYYLR